MTEIILRYFLYSLIILYFIVQACDSFLRRRKKLPPGPKPFPIIGNLLDLGENPHKSLANLSKTYGSIMTLKLGQVTTIVVSSSIFAREFLHINDRFFSDRTIPEAARGHDHAEHGLAWRPVSATWRTLRKICSTLLFSKKSLDFGTNLRHKKVEEMLLEVQERAKNSEAVEISRVAFNASMNLLSTTFFSLDLSDNSDTDLALELKDTIWKIMVVLAEPNVADYFPFLRKIDPQGVKRRATSEFKKLVDLFDRIISERMRAREATGRAEEGDVLDILIDMIGDEGREDQLNQTVVRHLLLDLFGAGTHTTASTLEWSLAELLKSPEIMSKAKEEMNKVIGKGNKVHESDVDRLPYLQAILKETLRLHPAAPLLLPRKSSADVEIGGQYTVPKGSQILVNAWAISRDPSVWDNPNEFKPERFVGSDVDVKGRDFGLIPFGSGRRICPGLTLATRMLHLMLGSLLHAFDWELESDVTPETMNMDEKFGLTLQMAKPLRAIPLPISANS